MKVGGGIRDEKIPCSDALALSELILRYGLWREMTIRECRRPAVLTHSRPHTRLRSSEEVFWEVVIE